MASSSPLSTPVSSDIDSPDVQVYHPTINEDSNDNNNNINSNYKSNNNHHTDHTMSLVGLGDDDDLPDDEFDSNYVDNEETGHGGNDMGDDIDDYGDEIVKQVIQEEDNDINSNNNDADDDNEIDDEMDDQVFDHQHGQVNDEVNRDPIDDILEDNNLDQNMDDNVDDNFNNNHHTNSNNIITAANNDDEDDDVILDEDEKTTATATTITTGNNKISTATKHSMNDEDEDDDIISDSPEMVASTSRRDIKSRKSSAATFTVKSKYLFNSSSYQSNQSTFEQQFANIFDDEEMLEIDFTGEDDLQSMGYFCIFCPDTFKDRDEARRHYQKHVNYYSMMCSLCGEGATDMQEFLRHHTEVHPEAKKGRYKRREQPLVDKWINGFLYAQATITRAFPPREQCPVCEKIFAQEQIDSARPRRCTVNRRIDHIHRHLCYLPYECVRCKEEGKEYSVAYFESKANNHIKLKHPEIDDTESRWFIFQKTISIPKLDDFIANYLAKFGISMEYERRPMKKQAREASISSNSSSGGGSNANNNRMFDRTLLSSSSDPYAPNDDGVIVLDDDDDADQSQAGDSSVASEEPNDGNSMIIAVSPSHAEYIESGRTKRRHSQEYHCLFCTAKFPCKLEAYPHFGEHLEYKPVLCLLCETKFHDTDAFTLHHQLNHPEATDLMYEIREDQNIERWVDEFLESQNTPLSHRLTLNCSCGACCPVCERLRPRRSSLGTNGAPCFNHNDGYFADHIHQHLAYNAYECTFCKKLGISTRLPNLDSAAISHVRENHFVSNATLYQLSRAFPKTLTIAKLERFIAESVQKRRLLEKKWRINWIEQLKLERLKMQHFQSSSSLRSPLQYPPTNGISSLDHDNSHLRTNFLASSFKSNVTHVRVEGGRVVNLPSTVSIKAIQQKNHKNNNNNNNTIDLTQETSKNDEGMIGISTGVRFYVKCLHCNVELPNRKQLKVHHRQEHPGLSMACFTTPKPIIASEGSP